MPNDVFKFMNQRNYLQVVFIFLIFGIKKNCCQYRTEEQLFSFLIETLIFHRGIKVCHNPVAKVLSQNVSGSLLLLLFFVKSSNNAINAIISHRKLKHHYNNKSMDCTYDMLIN